MEDDVAFAYAEEAEHGEEVLNDVRKMMDRPELLDLTFICENSQEVRANRALMASRSEYFSVLLYGGMRESNMDKVHLPHVRGRCLETVIGYIHGHPFRWNGDWDSMVEIYCLAEEYQIDGLCRRILLFVATIDSTREMGDLLNVAVPRGVEDILKAAVKVLNNVLAFNVKAFEGWSKDSIKYCLEYVYFDPTVTETLLAEAIISASNLRSPSTISASLCASLKVSTSLSSSSSSLPKEFLLLPPPPPPPPPSFCTTRDGRHVSASNSLKGENELEVLLGGGGGENKSSSNVIKSRISEGGSERYSLSKEDVAELFNGPLRLELIEPKFIFERIEPLGALPQEMLFAAYRTQAVRSYAERSQLAWYYKTPWRSMHRSGQQQGGQQVQQENCGQQEKRKDVVLDKMMNQMEVGEKEKEEMMVVGSGDLKLAGIPSIWDQENIGAGMLVSDGLPNRITCTFMAHHIGARMRLPLRGGKHFWKVRVLKSCQHFVWVGIVDSSADMGIWLGKQKAGLMYPSDGNTCRYAAHAANSPLPLPPGTGVEFDYPGDSVIVILDLTKRTLTFASDMETYLNYPGGQYPIAFPNLLSEDSALYPAVSMRFPACVEIEWISSSSR